MKRIDTGIVSNIKNKKIEVEILENPEECLSCPLHNKCKANIKIEFDINDDKLYNIGDRVQVEVKYGERLWIEFLLLGLPILLLVLGVILGDIFFHSQFVASILAVILFSVSLVIAIIFIKKKNRILYRLKR